MILQRHQTNWMHAERDRKRDVCKELVHTPVGAEKTQALEGKARDLGELMCSCSPSLKVCHTGELPRWLPARKPAVTRPKDQRFSPGPKAGNDWFPAEAVRRHEIPLTRPFGHTQVFSKLDKAMPTTQRNVLSTRSTESTVTASSITPTTGWGSMCVCGPVNWRHDVNDAAKLREVYTIHHSPQSTGLGAKP